MEEDRERKDHERPTIIPLHRRFLLRLPVPLTLVDVAVIRAGGSRATDIWKLIQMPAAAQRRSTVSYMTGEQRVLHSRNSVIDVERMDLVHSTATHKRPR